MIFEIVELSRSKSGMLGGAIRVSHEVQVDIDEEEEPSADLSQEDAEQMIEKMGQMVKDLEERTARAEEEARKEAEGTSIAKSPTECMICFDIPPRNPQLLECGHSACYPCLRLWWTRSTDAAFGDPIVSTDDEDNSDEEVTRYRFFLAVNKEKKCPDCKKVITQRPTSSCIHRIRPTKDERRVTRKDLWRGIFPEVVS